MTITVDISPEVQAELTRQAAAHGRAIEAYAASLLEEAVRLPADTNRPAFDRERAQAAGARIRELSKGVTLGGLTIRELIDEGRP
jgi:plasmid stability protein